MTTTELRKLLAKATEGTWYADQDGQGYLVKTDSPAYGDRMVCGGGNENHVAHDLDLIVAAVNALPALLDVAEAAANAVKGIGTAERFDAIGAERLESLDTLAEALARLREVKP